MEKSTASASVLAQVIASKVADHLLVHRQVKMFRRFGVELADQTLCGWLRQSAELFEPLYEGLKQFVLASKVVGTDRWFTITRRLGSARDRNGSLAKYKGYLQADAYAAYDSFFHPGRGLVEVGGWAHGRRHVYQARDTDPSRMGALLAYIGRLYAIGKRARQ